LEGNKNVYIETNEKIMGFKENQPKERITEKTLKEIETRKLATKCK